MCNSIKTLLKTQAVDTSRQGPLSIGDSLPSFCKKAVVNTAQGPVITEINQHDLNANGQWAILFWWPKDFTFVCPTEIIVFDQANEAFAQRKTFLAGASTDSEYVHLAWRAHHPGLKELSIPMIADTSKSLAAAMGILNEAEKVAYRATYILDPEGKIRWLSIYDMNVGRNVEEVIRVLDALQTGELTACGWTPGTPTLTHSLK